MSATQVRDAIPMEFSVLGSQGATPWDWHPAAVPCGASVPMLVSEETAGLPGLKAVFSALYSAGSACLDSVPVSATVLNERMLLVEIVLIR